MVINKIRGQGIRVVEKLLKDMSVVIILFFLKQLTCECFSLYF